MQIEFIYSFEDEPQLILVCPFVDCILQSKDTFFEFATSMLNGEQKEMLVKISCCIYYAVGLRLPDNHWYERCNGKFYSEEIKKLMIGIWAIKSLITL